jgi:hypothetical protein
MILFSNSDCFYARKRGVENFEKRDKDVERGKSKEKNMSMENKERKIEK